MNFLVLKYIVIYHLFLPVLPGIFDGFSADSDEVMDGLPDRLSDKSIDVQMEMSFPRYCIVGIFVQEYL